MKRGKRGFIRLDIDDRLRRPEHEQAPSHRRLGLDELAFRADEAAFVVPRRGLDVTGGGGGVDPEDRFRGHHKWLRGPALADLPHRGTADRRHMPRAIDKSRHLDQIAGEKQLVNTFRLGPDLHRHPMVAVLEVERAAGNRVDHRPERLDAMAAAERGPVAADRLKRHGRLVERHVPRHEREPLCPIDAHPRPQRLAPRVAHRLRRPCHDHDRIDKRLKIGARHPHGDDRGRNLGCEQPSSRLQLEEHALPIVPGLLHDPLDLDEAAMFAPGEKGLGIAPPRGGKGAVPMAHKTGGAHHRGVFAGPDPARDLHLLADCDRLGGFGSSSAEIDHDPTTIILDNEFAKGQIDVDHRSPHRHLRPRLKRRRGECRHRGNRLALAGKGCREKHCHGLDENASDHSPIMALRPSSWGHAPLSGNTDHVCRESQLADPPIPPSQPCFWQRFSAVLARVEMRVIAVTVERRLKAGRPASRHSRLAEHATQIFFLEEQA